MSSRKGGIERSSLLMASSCAATTESVLPCAAALRPEPADRPRLRGACVSLAADTAGALRAVFFAGTGELLRGRPRLAGDFRAFDFLANAIRDAILQNKVRPS